jgi:hypothetical protein
VQTQHINNGGRKCSRELLEVRVVEPIFNLKTVFLLNLKTIKKKKREEKEEKEKK